MLTLAVALLVIRPVAADEEALALGGTVTVHGQKLANGTIIFHLEDDEFVGTKIKAGAYKLTRVPAGEWRITIRGEGVPARFTLEETSGLRVAVKQGKNTIDIDLKK